MAGILEEDGDPQCSPAGAHGVLGKKIPGAVPIARSRISSELWEPSGVSNSFSLRDLGAASERRWQMTWALKAARGYEDRACFVLGE